MLIKKNRNISWTLCRGEQSDWRTVETLNLNYTECWKVECVRWRNIWWNGYWETNYFCTYNIYILYISTHIKHFRRTSILHILSIYSAFVCCFSSFFFVHIVYYFSVLSTNANNNSCQEPDTSMLQAIYNNKRNSFLKFYYNF